MTTPDRARVSAYMARHGVTELRAIQCLRDREKLRRIAFRTYPGGSVGPRVRAQMAESIEAHMALGRRSKENG